MDAAEASSKKLKCFICREDSGKVKKFSDATYQSKKNIKKLSLACTALMTRTFRLSCIFLKNLLVICTPQLKISFCVVNLSIRHACKYLKIISQWLTRKNLSWKESLNLIRLCCRRAYENFRSTYGVPCTSAAYGWTQRIQYQRILSQRIMVGSCTTICWLSIGSRGSKSLQLWRRYLAHPLSKVTVQLICTNKVILINDIHT